MLPIDRSNFSVRSRVFPDCRSCTKSRHLSASKPARACERQARYFPSGEYSGVTSAPGLVEILRGAFFGRATLCGADGSTESRPTDELIGTVKISLFVLVASTEGQSGSDSMLLV